MTDIFQLTRIDARTGKLERVTANERVASIVDAPNARQIVRSIDPQSLYGLVAEAGLNDCFDIVMLASAEQLCALLDFDCWTRDELDGERLKPWLEVLLQKNADDFARFYLESDLELWVVWLRQNCQVFLYERDQDILDTIDEPMMTSPDGVYAIVMPDEENVGNVLRHFLARVYEVSLLEGHKLLEASRWSLTTDSMERAYETRMARLGDLGFVPQHEAFEVFAWLEPRAFAARARALADDPAAAVIEFSEASTLPPVDDHLQALELHRQDAGGTVFIESLGALRLAYPGQDPDVIIDAVFSQYRAITNRVLVAMADEPGDLAMARAAVATVDRHVSIALEIIAGTDRVRSARVLAKVPLKDLHRMGFSVLLRLQSEARKIELRGNVTLTDSPTSLLDPDDTILFDGLRRKFPVMSADSGRFFSRREDVEYASARLAEIAFVEMVHFALFKHTKAELAEMLFDATRSATPVEFVTFRSLFATRILCELASSGSELRPLDVATIGNILRGLGTPQEAHSRLMATGMDLVMRRTKDPQTLAAHTTAYCARIAGWILDELGASRANTSREIASQVFIVAP